LQASSAAPRNAGHISYTRAREILLEILEIFGLDKNNF
jgi:hypothetical protein